MTVHSSARPTPSLRTLKRASILCSTIALGFLAAACGGTDSDDTADLPPSFNNGFVGGSQGTQQGTTDQSNGTNTNGSVNNGQTTNTNDQVGQNTNSEGASDNVQLDNTQNTNTQNSNTQDGSNTTDTQNDGAGGSAGVDTTTDPGNTGAGGGAMVGAGGGTMVVDDGQQDNGQQDDGQGDDQGTGQQPPPTAGSDTVCPADAIFCSGFEGTDIPAGATFAPGYLNANGQVALGNEIFLDSTQSNSGSQSLLMPVDGNFYRMLAVPTPSSYWIRLYTRSDVGFGAPGSTHAAIFMGSVIGPDGDYNGDTAVEIAEQFDQILLNVKDSLFGAGGTNPSSQAGTTLPNNEWVCMEAQFDGPSGDVHVYVEGNEIIDASGWQGASNFQSFRFGYLRYSSPARDVWMDDVVVATSRVGCL